jgi:8-oxo-dGTP diphosphatase
VTAAHQVHLVAVVIDGDRILLVEHRDSDRLELPSGPLQDGEDVLTGLRRCVGHATGLVVAVDRLTGVYTREGTGISLVFRARHVVGQIRPGPGVAGCRWVPLQVAVRALPPTAAEQVQHATAGTRTAEVIIGHQPRDTVARLRVAR